MTFKLIQLTDTHLFDTPDQTQKGVNTYRSLEKVVADVAATHPEFDALLLTGDLSQDETPDSYEALKEVLAPILTAPAYAIPGNHDDLDHMRSRLAGGGIAVMEDVRLGGWRIAMLNSRVAGRVHGELGRAQIDRLDASLQVSGEHTIIVLHHPPVTINSAWLDASRCMDGDELLDVAVGPPVKAIVCGHVHQEFEDTHNGVAILTTPSTCVQFKPAVEEFAIDEAAAPGYRIIELEDDGHWSTRIRRVKIN